MKTKILTLLNRFSIGKCLVIISIIIFSTSCDKENSTPKQAYNFQNYFFTEDIECYNAAGNRFDSLSYMYSQDKFIFSDEFEYPYKKIEINADSTVKMYYSVDDKENIKIGRVTLKNDSLYFYSNDLSSNNFLFKGIIIDNQLRIPGYGYIYHTVSSNGSLKMTDELKTIKLGVPEIGDLLEKFPQPSLQNHLTSVQKLYLQRFELVYDIKD